MARLPRIVIPGQPLHVIQRGNNRQAIFFSTDDYHKYLDVLRDASDTYGCLIHAYVLMTNHVHILLTPRQTDSVSQLMQGLGRSYVRYVNSAYGRSGTLWEGRYRSALIESERYFLTCSRYVELNPVRAGMVDGPGGYPWSSYRANALGVPDQRLSPHGLYHALGGDDARRRQAYRGLFARPIDPADIEHIRHHTQQCTVVGSKRFQDEIQRMLKRRVSKKDHGGDRKSERYHRSSVLTP